MEWRNLYRGAMMGITELVPGVSSGTIAVMLGIYDRLIAAINGITTKDWKRHLLFLIPLGAGMALALVGFSNIIKLLLTHFEEPTRFFFLGLIIGVVPLLISQSRAKETFKTNHYFAIIIAAILVGLMSFLPENHQIIESLTLGDAIVLFFAGWIASMFMLLPGISGSLVLLVLGAHTTAINALATFNLPILIVIGLGVLLGFFICSKLIKFLLKNYHYMTYAVIIGLVIGSTVVVYPGISSTYVIIPSLITFIGGAATAFLLGSKG
ncbi:DUF368 domain-containing protein [Evansella cellulosilytica]|uniref:DUF368 domain-containing protein n=1 Tax=Evansella cellulosilytica (strain ATCC 21833 / DSM 2522 / FERM P-1141 / JCM 9156 / N-4) TaxID=649639 RepID=E6TV79_EVAC2|nr:DUF368 domain-containing protein [Evansella cellulosilytica]ADU29763.1 protein of unknown function DUF368 [Evansella cellulosilytica DSM 2522]